MCGLTYLLPRLDILFKVQHTNVAQHCEDELLFPHSITLVELGDEAQVLVLEHNLRGISQLLLLLADRDKGIESKGKHHGGYRDVYNHDHVHFLYVVCIEWKISKTHSLR